VIWRVRSMATSRRGSSRARCCLGRGGYENWFRLCGSTLPMARSCALVLTVFVTLAAVATEPALAGPLTVQTSDISFPSPFTGGPCTEGNTGFDPGFSQETSVAVNPRNPRNILVAWIQDGRATDLVMASRDGGRSFSRILVPGLSAAPAVRSRSPATPGLSFRLMGGPPTSPPSWSISTLRQMWSRLRPACS
jgi:hypothetical protein